MHPLPVERLWGVGAITAAKLHADGIRTIGELARREEVELTADGRQGRGPAPVGAGQPARPAAGRGRPAPPVDRLAVRDRSAGQEQEPDRARGAARRAGRPGRPAAARRGADRQTFTLRLRLSTSLRGRAGLDAGLTRSRAADRGGRAEPVSGCSRTAWPLRLERARVHPARGNDLTGPVERPITGELEAALFPRRPAREPRLDAALDRVRASSALAR